MPETIEAKELQLVSIFGENYRFEIPEYQRPYAWTTEEAGELLDDLLHAMGNAEDVGDVPPLFPGQHRHHQERPSASGPNRRRSATHNNADDSLLRAA